MKQKREWILLIIALIPILIAGCKNRTSEDRCDYDGFHVQPLYAVYFSLQDGSEKKYCSLVCASMSFSALKKQIREVRVVDEPSGNKINALGAFFVESEVVTVPHVKNRIHVFAKKEDALKHIQTFKGNWVENPFR
jgi:hypothetical protein